MAASPAHAQSPPDRKSQHHLGYRRQQRLRQWRLRLLELALGTVVAAITVALRGLIQRSPLVGINAEVTALACMALLAVGLTGMEWQRSHRGGALRLNEIPQAFGLAALVIFAILFFLRELGNRVSRPTLAVYALLAALCLLVTHALVEARRRRHHLAPTVHAIAVGPKARIVPLVQQLRSSPDFEVHPVYCDGLEEEAAIRRQLDELCQTARRLTADEILLSLETPGTAPVQSAFYQGVLDLCEEMGIHLRLWIDWLPGHSHVYLDYLGESPVLTFAYSRASHRGLAVKRGFDLVLGLTLLTLSLPVIAAAALAIRLDSPGPVLFRQPRCGLRGRPFQILKLRTMRDGAAQMEAALRSENELSGPAFKMARDPRITRVGRFLRRSSIDELPQFWNVVRGDMSLVGPRPAPTSEVALYPPGYFRKLAMKPGITGLWQVSGRTRIVDFERRIELDTAYIRNWSLGQDALILLRTLGVVLRCTGV